LIFLTLRHHIQKQVEEFGRQAVNRDNQSRKFETFCAQTKGSVPFSVAKHPVPKLNQVDDGNFVLAGVEMISNPAEVSLHIIAPPRNFVACSIKHILLRYVKGSCYPLNSLSQHLRSLFIADPLPTRNPYQSSDLVLGQPCHQSAPP